MKRTFCLCLLAVFTVLSFHPATFAAKKKTATVK